MEEVISPVKVFRGDPPKRRFWSPRNSPQKRLDPLPKQKLPPRLHCPLERPPMDDSSLSGYSDLNTRHSPGPSTSSAQSASKVSRKNPQNCLHPREQHPREHLNVPQKRKK